MTIIFGVTWTTLPIISANNCFRGGSQNTSEIKTSSFNSSLPCVNLRCRKYPGSGETSFYFKNKCPCRCARIRLKGDSDTIDLRKLEFKRRLGWYLYAGVTRIPTKYFQCFSSHFRVSQTSNSKVLLSRPV